MLVLSRRKDESVIIRLPDGTTIQVMITAVHGDKVRIGFNAPKEVIILREEVVPHDNTLIS